MEETVCGAFMSHRAGKGISGKGPHELSYHHGQLCEMGRPFLKLPIVAAVAEQTHCVCVEKSLSEKKVCQEAFTLPLHS